MSEHELWNELGNLYCLSGFNNQAVHAYNKAIQFESDYGKPYSNLALIYAKQAKYEDAIRLFKKSLDLLTDDIEKAITWNRLGNVYRKLKKYQEAVYAYHCADDLMSKNDEIHEQSNQMLYISSEPEYLSYEVVEEHHDIQNHHADFTLDVEPEFDETLPEAVCIETEILVNEILYYQNTHKSCANKNIAEPVPTIPAKDTEIPVPVQGGSGLFTSSENIDAKEVPQAELEAETLEKPEEWILPEEPLSEWVVLEPDSCTLPEVSRTKQEVEAASDRLVSTALDGDKCSEGEVFEADFKSPEPIARVEEDVEVLPDRFMQTVPEINILSGEDMPDKDSGLAEPTVLTKDDKGIPTDESVPVVPEASVRPDREALEVGPEFIEPIAQAEEDVEALPDELAQSVPETNVLPDESVSGMDYEFTKPIAPAEDGPVTNEEHNSDPISSFLSMDMIQETVNEDTRASEKEIGSEVEEELAKQIEINPRSATTWEALGTLYKTAGRYEEAIQAFKQAISISPREVSYYHNLGLVYAAQGNNKDAFNTFQKVLELDPNHSLTHASLGGYYKKMGLDELAQRHIGKAMKHIYESENEYNRACLDAICGNVDQAIELLRIALEHKQTYVDWVINDPDLDSLRGDERFKQLVADFSK